MVEAIDLARLIDRDTFNVEPGILSVLPKGERAAHYDKIAGVYDAVIGSGWYNRWMWGNTLAQYDDFAIRALTGTDGPVLDAGCGSLVFTGHIYQQCTAPALLMDLSLGMLRRAASRIDDRHPRLLLQANLYDLPFPDASFDRVCSFAISHVPDNRVSMFKQLRRVIRPEGKLFLSSLVTGARIGDLWAKILRLLGELAAPYSADELAAELRSVGFEPEIKVCASLAYVQATPM